VKRHKPIILTSVGCYLTGYKSCSSVRSIGNMTDRLGDQLDLRIIISDRDMGDSQPYPNMVVDGWFSRPAAGVFRLARKWIKQSCAASSV
jgi:hypothetical protein